MTDETKTPEAPEPEKEEEEKQEPKHTEGDTIQQVLADVAEAQGKLARVGKSPGNLVRHLQEVTYPLLARTAGLSADLRDALREALAEGPSNLDDEYVSEENLEFFRSYVDEIIFPFVLKYSAGAKEEASKGNDALHRELLALYQGGLAMKKILAVIEDDNEDEGGVEEDDDANS